jgi:hypothetical protein
MIKYFITLTTVCTFFACTNPSDKSENNPNSKNEIIENYSSPQKLDSINGSGQQVVPVKLVKGVAIFDLKVENNYDELSRQLGQVMGSNIILMIKGSDGRAYPDAINTISTKYKGSISFSVPKNDTYIIDITTSSLSNWTLKIK